MAGGKRRFDKILKDYSDIIQSYPEGTHNKYDLYELQYALEVFRQDQINEALKNASYHRDMNRKLDRYK